MNIVDHTEKAGIAHGKLAILFGNVVRHLPRLRIERNRKRYRDRAPPKSKRPRKRKHAHKRIVGPSQMSILFEELFRQIPSNRVSYRSPLGLALSFLRGGKGGRARIK